MKKIIQSVRSLKWAAGLPVGLMLLGVGLRCIELTTRSIQYDDAFSFFLARKGLDQIIAGTAADTMPPLYYFLLHFWLQFNTHIGWLRLLSVVLNVGAGLFLYLLLVDLAGKRAGVWGLFLFSISPLQIYHAQDLRMYSLLAFCQLGYFFFSLRVLRGQGRARLNWLGLIFMGTGAMYSHNLAIFGLILPNALLIIRREWKMLGKVCLAQLVIGMFSAPWLLMIPGQVEKIQRAFWTPQPGLVEIIQAIIVMTTNLPLDGIWLVVGAVISIELFVLIVWMSIRRVNQAKLVLLMGVFLPPLLLFIASYLMRPVFVPRGFITSTALYLGLAGVVMADARGMGMKSAIGIGFVMAAVMALPYQLAYRSFPRSDFEGALSRVSGVIQPGEVIIHDNKLSYFPSHYYDPTLPQVFLADEAGSPNDTYALASQQAMGLFPRANLADAARGAKGVYFVFFQTTREEYLAMGFKEHPVLLELEEKYDLADKYQVSDLWVYTYR